MSVPGPSPFDASRQRFIDAQGRMTFVVAGLPRRRFGDYYHRLVTATWPQLLALLVGLYVAANAAFALGYWLDRGGVENARPGSYTDAFFFSVQTMATIGYGRMSPVSLFAHVLVAIEALAGLVAVAMVTGMVFAKFSVPTARVMFSRVLVVSQRNGVPSLMFRMANQRRNQIVEAQLRVVLARSEVSLEGEPMRRFYDLDLNRSSSSIFALSWTAVHPINERSPLFGKTPADLSASRTEIIASLIGLDGSLNQTVHARHGWTAADIHWEAKLVDLFGTTPDGRPQIDYTRFHDWEPLPTAPRG